MKKRIESKTSQTASWTCFCRAIAYTENDYSFKGPDNISLKLIPFLPKLLFIKCKLFRKLFIKYLSPTGIYEYVLARTKVFDEVFEYALENNFKQIVLFGAGFDSRAIRFNNKNQVTTIFELDSPLTQKAKTDIFRKKGINIPKKAVFVPVDFNRQKLSDVLYDNQYDKSAKTLFVLEGITMYLTDDAIKSTFKFLSNNSPKGSIILFDYIYKSVLRKEKRYYGEKAIYSRVDSAKETWTFGIEEGGIEIFLNELGLILKKHYTSEVLTNEYLTSSDGRLYGKINETHSIALAEIK